MKKSKIFRRLAAALLAGTMMVAMGTTVFAEDGDGPTDNVTGSVSFTKTLDMTEADGASVPDVTFKYTINAIESSGEVVVAATDTTPEILNGVGSPSVSDVVYTHNDTADSDSKVKKAVSVDFSSVTFTKPGIYRYVITEQASENPDITDDTNKTRYLDVYVVNGTNGYEIASSRLLADAVIPSYSTDKSTIDYGMDNKSAGYTNKYTTYQLSLDKVVSGTMGDKGKEFDFTITFSGPANASFTYDGKPVQLDESGNGSVGIKLTDGTQAAVITGIPSTVKYTVTENIETKEGYTTSYTINDRTAIESTTTGEQTMGTANNAVVCTNVKNAVTPTGIVMNIAPYVLMVAVAAVLAVVFLRKRNNFEN